MAKKYRQNQRDKLKEHFREHPYFKLCKTVFKVFQESCPTMLMTPEEFFIDASQILDRILQTGDISTEICQGLWTEKYNQYREQEQTAGDKNDTMAEVAMIFYMVMYGLASVKHSHYCGTLQRTLYESISKFYGRKKCTEIEHNLHDPVNLHSKEMQTWMEDYFTSTESLTKEIQEVLQPKRTNKSKGSLKEEDKTPYVLKYICKDETTRTNRLQRALILMQNWNWIEEPKDADDFYDFFNGENRVCNLKWKTGKGGTNTTVLTFLIQSLNEQSFFEKMTKASIYAILKNQFGLKTISYNFERVSTKDKNRISLIIVILDPEIKFKELPRRGRGDGFDYNDAVLYEVYKKELHKTKDLNKRYYE